MATLQERLGKPYFETKGSGKATFEDGFEIETNFSIQVSSNGRILGDIELPISR